MRNVAAEPASLRSGTSQPVAISVITPVYNEALNVEELYARLTTVLGQEAVQVHLRERPEPNRRAPDVGLHDDGGA